MVEAYEAGDRQYSYLDNVDLTKVKAVLDEKQKHLDYFVAAVKDKGPTDDPTVFTADLFKSYQVRLLSPSLLSPNLLYSPLYFSFHLHVWLFSLMTALIHVINPYFLCIL